MAWVSASTTATGTRSGTAEVSPFLLRSAIPGNGAATETARTATVDAGEYKVYGRAFGPGGVVNPISIDPGAM